MFVLPSGLMVTKNNHMKRKQIHKPDYDLSPWVFFIVCIVIFYCVDWIEKWVP